MKKKFLTLLILLPFFVSSQETFYAYRSDWSNTTNMKEAAFIKQVTKEDTVYVCRYYNIWGPMLRMETYKDAALEIPMGRFAWYNQKGELDSIGNVIEGRKDGRWLYYAHPDSSYATIQEEYNNGKFLYRVDYVNKKTTYRDGRVVPFDTVKLKDTVTVEDVHVQVEAKFVNGVKGWVKYIQKSLKVPARFESLYPNGGRATVIIGFVVLTDGSIGDVFIYKSAELSADREAVRVIREGPKWEPATQDGKKVKYRQRQSITFVVSEE